MYLDGVGMSVRSLSACIRARCKGGFLNGTTKLLLLSRSSILDVVCETNNGILHALIVLMNRQLARNV